MNKFLGLWLFAFLWVLTGCGGPGSNSKPSAHSKPPAEVMQISDELELASVRLSESAEKRLGVTVTSVKHENVTDRKSYPGVLVVPPQSQSSMLAPVAGVVRSSDSAQTLAVGTKVTKDQALFSLEPIQTMESFTVGPAQRDQLKASRIALEQSKAAIQSRIDIAQAGLKAAEIERRRSEQLFQEKVGSRKRVDDAQAQENLARETLEAAQREIRTLRRVDTETEAPAPASAPPPLIQRSPLSGTVLRVQVASGQSVSAGQVLVDLVDLSRLWVRVRLPQGEVKDIDTEGFAELGLSDRTLSAMPVEGPPTADQTMATLDRYYLLENSASGLAPDQRVEVSLPLKRAGTHLVVPTASVLYDLHGGSWVYVRSKTLLYRRVRIQVELGTPDGKTVLTKGPDVGALVVVDGAAELYGIEFGND